MCIQKREISLTTSEWSIALTEITVSNNVSIITESLFKVFLKLFEIRCYPTRAQH